MLPIMLEIIDIHLHLTCPRTGHLRFDVIPKAFFQAHIKTHVLLSHVNQLNNENLLSVKQKRKRIHCDI